jgi:chromosome segregation ATPase
MSNDFERNDFEKEDVKTAQTRSGSRTHILWYAAIVLSLAANAYLLFMTHDLANGASQMHDALSAQISAVDQKVAADRDDSQQRIDSVSSEARQAAAVALQQATEDNRKNNARLASTLAKHQAETEQVAGALDDLKTATATASSKIDEVSGDVSNVKGDVSNVKADVASTRSELETTGTELKRVNGDLGVLSGLIATNGKELAALRELGERNYFEFSIKKTGAPEKVADVRLTLRKTDPKKNRFTLDVNANDKTTEKRDRTINEPIQFYVAGDHQPYEIVINTVTKDTVTGYLATPKTKIASR